VTKIWDRHFFKYAGAEPPGQMRKEQRKAHNAYVSGLTYEKPKDSPDRPDNIERAAAERVKDLPEVDNPSKILGAMSAFRAPFTEGEEPGVVKDGPDNPSHILAANSEFRPQGPPPEPPLEADDPAKILGALSQFTMGRDDVAEMASLKASPDNPGAITASLLKPLAPDDPAGPPIEADSPSSLLRALTQPRPDEPQAQAIGADSPSSILGSLGQAQAPAPKAAPNLADLPAEFRPASSLPEQDSGRVITGEA
jgi:hypothetical protein